MTLKIEYFIIFTLKVGGPESKLGVLKSPSYYIRQLIRTYLNFLIKGMELEAEMDFGSIEIEVKMTKFL